MTARRRRPGRARRTRYVPRHAAGTTYRPLAQATADRLAGDDLMALADALYGPDGKRQAEMIAACDFALWEMEPGSAP